MAPQLTKAHSIPGELHKIRAYVDATNTRISYLSELLEPTFADEITEIKRGLKNAHRGLEKLETRFQECLNLMAVEQPVAYVPTGAGKTERRVVDLTEDGEREEDEDDSAPDMKDSSGLTSASAYEDNSGADTSFNEVGARFDASATRGLGYVSWESVEESTTLNDDSHFVVRRRDSRQAYFLKASPRPKVGILAKIYEEEARASTELHDPDRVRMGSTSGWLITLAVMSGMEDDRYVLPKLACIKIHEVKDMKRWLLSNGYLQRSGAVSRIEKMLHFLFLLQMGCRMETIAIVFSRSPRQVHSSCKDVLQGVLEMHSETKLPRTGKWPTYPQLWLMSQNYETAPAWSKKYYPWTAVDFQMVVLTLNLYIGRYRKQGQFALEGPFLDWGRYVRPEDGE